MMRAGDFTGFERCELEGLREGVLQMECLLQTLRQAVDGTPDSPGDRRIADDVERHVAAPRPRPAVYGSVASVYGDGPDAPSTS